MSQNQPDGYLALPANGYGRPVLVLHPWWGLNDTIKNVCTRLAEAGFVAFAPDLFRGEVTDTIPGAEALAEVAFGRSDEVSAEVAQAAAFVLERAGQAERGVAVIGFSFGAWFALELSTTHPELVHSVVVFYGARPVDDYDRSQARYLGHFAETDEYESQEDIDETENALRDAGRPVKFYHYPGTGHWFFEPDRTDAYHADSARLAWERTLDFLAGSADS